MSESADRGRLSGLARSIDALFAAPAAPAAEKGRAEAPPTPTEADVPLHDALISPEPPAQHDEVPALEETMIVLPPGAGTPEPRPRKPEMFPATQMFDVIKADAPERPPPLPTVLGAPPEAAPWSVEIDPVDVEAPHAWAPEAQPVVEAPLTFPAKSESLVEAPHQSEAHEAAREDSVEAFSRAVDALVTGDHGARERVESLAATLRERLALDPLANAVERLVSAAGDPPDPWLLEVAGSVMNPAVASRLVQRMGQEQDEAVRVGYITLCGRLGLVMANAVKGALTGATGPQVRRAYYDAMISMGDASRPVIEKMLEDENRFLVRDAVVILGETGGPRAVELVTSALADTDPRVRMEALRALGKLGDNGSGQLVLGLLGDSDPDVRIAAAVAAGELKLARALRPLLQMLEGENDPEACVRLLGALGRIGDPGAVQAIEKRAVPSMFSKPSTDVRVAAYRALHEIGTPHARELVQQALRDKDAGIRVALRDLARAT